jgi:hypothetical protein
VTVSVCVVAEHSVVEVDKVIGCIVEMTSLGASELSRDGVPVASGKVMSRRLGISSLAKTPTWPKRLTSKMWRKNPKIMVTIFLLRIWLCRNKFETGGDKE